jgi:hypothetical protein
LGWAGVTRVKGSIALFGVHLYYNGPINIILDPIQKRPSLRVFNHGASRKMHT